MKTAFELYWQPAGNSCLCTCKFESLHIISIIYVKHVHCAYTGNKLSISKSMSKQTEDAPKQFKREYIWVFLGKFRVVSICFGLLRNSSVCFGCFGIDSKHRNKPNFFVFGFTKQTETNAKQILFRFVLVRTKIFFCLFRGHPTWLCWEL